MKNFQQIVGASSILDVLRKDKPLVPVKMDWVGSGAPFIGETEGTEMWFATVPLFTEEGRLIYWWLGSSQQEEIEYVDDDLIKTIPQRLKDDREINVVWTVADWKEQVS